MSKNAWIVSEDSELAVDLGEALQATAGCTLMSFPHPRASCDYESSGTADWLFLDLRDAQRSETVLEAWRDWNSQRDECVPLIGIVNHGLATEWAVLADQTLAGTLHWPFSDQDLPSVLRQASEAESARFSARDNGFRLLRGNTLRLLTYEPDMFPVVEELAVAAQHDFTILLIGETGTGKTTLARLIHELSARSQHRFLTVGCGALPNELIDSELFGHIKGSFTGADKTKQGKFDAARDGTILLDEIDVLGLRQQAKMLRILETGEYEAVGSNETQTVKARTIVASNFPLEMLIERGQFRPDLYYRLNQMKLEIPPLRKRPRDIVPLAIQFIEELCQENGMTVNKIDPDLLAVLREYSWPGNLRELRNEVRRAVLVSGDGVLTPHHLTPAIVQEVRTKRAEAAEAMSVNVGLADGIALAEQDAIEQMLEAQNFNRTATARALGISRVTLYNKIRKYGIRLGDADSEENE